MDKSKPMTVVLIEDDVGDCINFKDCANRRSDISFVGMTDSAEEGLKLVQSRLPEAVILDLQLARGSGSGIQFLEMLNKTNLTFRPIVMVTSTNQSRIVNDRIEELGADWYFCKKQRDYSEDFVFDTLLSLRRHLRAGKRTNRTIENVMIESPEERQTRIYKRIDAELDLIGVRAKYKGRTYLREGIFLQICAEKKTVSVIEQIAVKNKNAYNTISTVMQTAINDAWGNSAPEELLEHYTARISIKAGTPTPSDFIHYYADKIRNSI
ncbi:MAG: response regulator [Defluviitaleaceae bacterium]|nr:response regulator [Defluviitaleaceae bacterium]